MQIRTSFEQSDRTYGSPRVLARSARLGHALQRASRGAADACGRPAGSPTPSALPMDRACDAST